mmetsp:Transcript_1857/g.2990  ORF Transcript_1857/g.2990 Transcript_1857/m.2990 type:complete len:312 (+) Transcript_1857:56-991(+)
MRSASCSIKFGEESHAISHSKRKTKISNTKHTNASYHYQAECAYCKPCVLSCCRAFTICLIILAVSSGISVGGYFTVLSGIKRSEYGDSFNIDGVCEVTSSEVVSKTCTRTYQECTGTGEDEKCETKTEKYDCSYTSVDYRVNERTNSTRFPCAIGSSFSERYDGRKWSIQPGQMSTCWTNEHCDEIFLSTTNRHHGASGGIYFGASLVFCVALVGCPAASWFCRRRFEDVAVDTNAVYRGVRHEYTLYHDGKCKFYQYQWREVMNHEDRFDYVMNYWIRHYCPNGYDSIDDGGLCYEIESLVFDYYLTES